VGCGIYGCFVCECETVLSALSLFSVDGIGDFPSANFLFVLLF
jgi:hypothetical protein